MSESVESNEPRIRLVSDFSEGWARATELLSRPINDISALKAVVHSLHALTHTDGVVDRDKREYEKARSHDLAGLAAAVAEHGDGFWTHVLPFVQRVALALPSHGVSALPLLLAPSAAAGRDSVVLRRSLALSILANAFLCNHRDVADQVAATQVLRPDGFHPGEFGCFDLYLVESYAIRVGIERLKCFIAYFAACAREVPEGTLPGSLAFFRTRSAVTAGELSRDAGALGEVFVHSGPLETPDVPAIVDFANRDLHIGGFIPSATQEEVLFSCRPELFIGMLFCQRMRDDDAIVISGAPAVVEYSGYGNSFRCSGCPESRRVVDLSRFPPQVVIAIDAVMEDQFTKTNVLRDTVKAIAGFAPPFGELSRKGGGVPAISTGKWGCGAFGGDLWLKFIQQLIAAGHTHRALHFSAFGHQEEVAELGELLAAIKARTPRVCDLWRVLEDFSGTTQEAFRAHVKARLF